jgi:hypothetical protein
VNFKFPIAAKSVVMPHRLLSPTLMKLASLRLTYVEYVFNDYLEENFNTSTGAANPSSGKARSGEGRPD